jgi:phage-related minor tail protein
MQKKGAGPLAEMSLTLPVILQKAREGFLSIFAKLGPAVKPFMKAVKELFGNFNKGTPIIKSLQKIATEVFTVIFKYATIAVKAIGAVIKWFGGTKGISKAWAGVKAAFSAVISVLSIFWPILRGIVVGAVVGIMMIVAYVQSLVAAWDEFSSVIGAVGDVVSGVIDSALGAVSGFADGAIDAASSFISGLVGGISSGAGAVVDAVKNLASGALGAFKSVLGIHSPSKVMAKMGGFAAEGAAQGLDKGSDRVEASGAKLGGAMASGAAGAAGGAKGGKGSVSVTIAAGAVTIHAGGANIDEEKLAIVLERLLASQGVFA